ncbi:hypothetical protein CW751_13515 [Brumimicrobium salinarum]|uniref:AB hydrolase-1 domain-containing protein n=1 Tax=Brumimicrobium salinarum TaxID=2058658 RepID=A0A2I0QZJ3_9FLAO|nr:alpha/beta hydrolase [Brumimicrobium salinarum]PKR79738.1 hypothetical protein CW751_13515 [Brumimicrobium salinarum]
MLRLIIAIVGLFTLSLSSCKNIVKKYDQHLHKKYNRNDFQDHSVELSQHKIFYYDNKRENAPVLLFIHGFGGDGKISWKEQIKEFEDDYRVIVPDLLWFGHSTSDATPNLDSQIEAIHELTNYLSIKDIHLVGISYGGFVSLGLAEKYKEKWASLTIVDSPGVHFTDDELDAFCDKVGAANLEDAFVPKNSDEVKRLMEFSFRNAPPLTDHVRALTLGVYFSKHPKEQRKLLRELPRNRKKFENLNIKVPVLILWGEEDEIFLVADAHALQEQLNAQLVIVPKAGHALPFEQAKAFNEHLETFISNIE